MGCDLHEVVRLDALYGLGERHQDWRALPAGHEKESERERENTGRRRRSPSAPVNSAMTWPLVRYYRPFQFAPVRIGRQNLFGASEFRPLASLQIEFALWPTSIFDQVSSFFMFLEMRHQIARRGGNTTHHRTVRHRLSGL